MASLLPPKLSQRFLDVQVLGKGAYGRVLRAHDPNQQLTVAIKMLHPRIYREESMEKRFWREAELVSKIESPYVAKLFDYGIEEGRPYLVFEYLDGSDLKALLRERGKPFPLDEAATIYFQILEALEAVHAQGILHRDLKPDNLLWTREGRCVLTDFGLSREIENSSLTMSGQLVGTASHLPPQQLLGERADPTVDVYGATMIFVELVIGKDPFRAKNFVQMKNLKMQGFHPGLRERGILVSAHFDELIQSALAAEVEDRPRDLKAFRTALGRALLEESSPPTAPTPLETQSLKRTPRPEASPKSSSFQPAWLVAGVALGVALGTLVFSSFF